MISNHHLPNFENDDVHSNYDLKKCQSCQTTQVSHHHFGQDLSGHNSSLGIVPDFLETTILNNPSSGKRKIFVVGLSNILIELEIANHVALEIDGPISFT